MATSRRTRLIRSRRLWGAFSLAAHVGVLAALLSVAPEPIRRFEPEPMPVELVAPRIVPPPTPPQPPTPEPEPAPPQPKTIKPPPQLKARKPVTPPPEVVTLAAKPAPFTAPGDELSDAEVASAATSGSGGGGGGCNMAQWLEEKLRKDATVQTAMASVPRGKAVLVWRGDWVRHGGEEGEGLAKVREVIMWEVAFAPEACRKQPVHGLVLLKLAEGPGAPRLVVGSGTWRWSDLLFARSRGRG